jgi:hypothetical protein
MPRYVKVVWGEAQPLSTGKKLSWSPVSMIVPKANPDFHDRYDRVREWWLEIAEDQSVLREIGFAEG